MELLQQKAKELDAGFKAWTRKQPAPVEVALVTGTTALQGALMGGLVGRLTTDLNTAYPQTVAYSQPFSGGPMVQARNVAVIAGVNAGITCAMKRLRGGIEDAQTSLVSGFGAGACLSLVGGMGGENIAMGAITTGLTFGLVQAGLFKIGQTFFQAPVDDMYYAQSRGMLRNLGLQRYEKNFKKGMLTDSTLPLLTDSALRDVNIPPGPRLIILDHMKPVCPEAQCSVQDCVTTTKDAFIGMHSVTNRDPNARIDLEKIGEFMRRFKINVLRRNNLISFNCSSLP